MTQAKQAVIFGAGNIGRGFLGQLFTESGYEVVFVEINRRLVDRLNQQGSYTLRMVNNELSQDLIIAPVRAVDGRDEEAVAREVVAADLLATAVGVRALPQVAPVLALGIARRAEAGVGTPLNIILCENLKNASQVLQGMVQEHLPGEHHRYLAEKVGFVEAVIARMVPILPDEVREQDPTLVVVEPYKVLPVDKKGFKGAIPDIVGLEPREDFAAYVDRKLYLHNAGHAMLGYLGYQKGLGYGYEALDAALIRPLLDQALDEAAQALVAEHGFDPKDLRAHVADLLTRFANRPLGDTIFRLARDPIRKLGPTDRLVGGARAALKHGIEPQALSWGIAAGLAFDDPRDPQASRLQEMLREQGLDAVLAQVCGLDPAGRLAEMVRERYGRVVRCHEFHE
ncbi:MAG: mannitol-1-phosphate 5-dehydrogenase [Chloroflexi bacterium]|nr:mannitol-1-phosphate 5-dehydrogenase [Chloroflexota bacterium]